MFLMKRLKKILLCLVALAGLFLVAGFLLPARARVERSATMRAKPEAVFARAALLKRWPEWTAWTTNRFPDLNLRFDGPESGVGAMMIAEGKSSGNGTVKITRADPARGVWYDLHVEHGNLDFQGAITFVPVGDALIVTWAIETGLGANPLKRWGGLLLDKLMGGDLAEGLANLKRLTEATQ